MCSIVVLKVTGTGFCQNWSLISRLVFRPCFASVIVLASSALCSSLSISLLTMKAVLFFGDSVVLRPKSILSHRNYFASVILIWQPSCCNVQLHIVASSHGKSSDSYFHLELVLPLYWCPAIVKSNTLEAALISCGRDLKAHKLFSVRVARGSVVCSGPKCRVILVRRPYYHRLTVLQCYHRLRALLHLRPIYRRERHHYTHDTGLRLWTRHSEEKQTHHLSINGSGRGRRKKEDKVEESKNLQTRRCSCVCLLMAFPF